jgi:hypothetical protein
MERIRVNACAVLSSRADFWRRARFAPGSRTQMYRTFEKAAGENQKCKRNMNGEVAFDAMNGAVFMLLKTARSLSNGLYDGARYR